MLTDNQKLQLTKARELIQQAKSLINGIAEESEFYDLEVFESITEIEEDCYNTVVGLDNILAESL